MLYAGALAAGIANVFVFNAIRLVGPTRVTVTQFLVPAGAVILGAMLLDEPIGSPRSWAARSSCSACGSPAVRR